MKPVGVANDAAAVVAVGNINKFNLTADSNNNNNNQNKSDRQREQHTQTKRKPQVINFYDLFYGNAARATRRSKWAQGRTGGGGT